MQNFGHRRSVQKSAQNAGSNVLKSFDLFSSYEVIQTYYLHLVCSEYLTRNCGYNDNVTMSVETVSSKKMLIIDSMLLKCIYVHVYSDII